MMLDITELPLGTTRHLHLRVEMDDGAGSREMPVCVLVGRRRAPCVAFVAAVHGDEYDGIVALHELARELDPTQLNGGMIIIPVANPFAFEAAQRRTPQDDKDLNRVFPGRADGSLTERLATVRDLRGTTVREVRASRAGVVGGFHAHAGARVGEVIYSLWSPARARVYDAGKGDDALAPADWPTVTGTGMAAEERA
jgi:predicted deacylase